MDKSQLRITGKFASETESQRRENLKRAVDEYIRLQLKKGGLSSKEKSPEGES